MAVTSIYIDQGDLSRAKRLVGAKSNRETVDIALKTLIAVRNQPDAVERIIGRQFVPEQLNLGASDPDVVSP